MESMIKAGIVGGAGYTAGELARILLHHPQAQIAYIHSNSHAGQPIASVHQDLEGDTDLVFAHEANHEADVLFLCLGHGKSAEFLAKHPLPPATKVVDLSHDFRLAANATQGDRDFVYGLPECHREAIAQSSNIANPGCFATAIQLALLPLAAGGHIHGPVHVHAITGSTGAGQSLSATTHFTWRNNNVSVYKAFNHQHLHEIGERLASLQPGLEPVLNFIPVRGNYTRGILATAYTQCAQPLDEVRQWYNDYYQSARFTHLSAQALHLKQAVNTNKCLLHVERHGDQVLVTSIIDNLLKGASGQAVQNMNIMFGIDEDAGLNLKSTLH